MIRIKATIAIRTPRGQFPPGSFVRALSPCRQELQRDVIVAFAEAKDPVTGKAWPARKHVYPWPILQKSLAMKNAAVNVASAAMINGSAITLTMQVPRYGQFHMTGTKNMAKRRFVGCSLTTRAALKRRLASEGLRIIRGERLV